MYSNYIALGDINFDQRIILQRFQLEEKFQGEMHQIVNQITREKTIMKKDKNGNLVESKSSTTIDLIFLKNSLMTKCSNSKVLKKMPSDHNLVYFKINLDIPKRFTEREFRPDPRRRPKIQEKDIPKAKELLSQEFGDYKTLWQNLSQSECFSIIETSTRKVLDQLCPLNPDEAKIIRVWRERFSKEFRVAKNRRLARLNEVRKARKNLARDPNNDFLIRKVMSKEAKFRFEDSRYKAQRRQEQNRKNQEESKLIREDAKNIWQFVRSCDEIEKRSDSAKMVIKNQEGDIFEGNNMANHMNEFLYNRARLVDDKTIENNANHLAKAEFDFCGIIFPTRN